MFRIMIGYDPNETVAYHVCCQSIMDHASGPVAFTPINKRNIPEFTRGIEDGATEFSFSRFLTPYLADYKGWALFMDCDMILRDDIYDMFNEIEPGYDVYVVKHDYIPSTSSKFLGAKQHIYPKKNWSSVMLMDCSSDSCQKLTVDYVNNATGAQLHQFKWMDESKIGELPATWNHLVGEYKPNPKAKLVHYTLGTPCFNDYKLQEHSGEWFEILERVNYANN